MTITAQTLSWIPLSIYLCSAIPQFATNIRRKSAAGVSHWMLFMRVASGIFYNSYLFLCLLPLAHRTIMPLYSGSLAILAIQGYWLEPDKNVRWRLRWAYSSVLLGVGIGLVYAWAEPQRVGMLFGWIGVAIALFCDWPQIYHNWHRKSVQGFNFLFASGIGVGALIEMCIAYWFSLPLPTLANPLRAFMHYLVYCTQFLLYRA